MDFSLIFQKIGLPDHPILVRDLKPLSDLDPAERAAFLAVWQRIPAERRREILRVMVDLAEDNVDLHFHAIMSWCLEDPDGAVRSIAIEGLWESDSPQVLRRLLELVRGDADMAVRETAVIGLGRFAYLGELGELDGELARRLLRDLLGIVADQRQPAEVRRRALESAGYFASEDTVREQIELAYTAEEQERKESALVAMGRSMLPRWLPTIARELESRSPALRYEAARAAGEYGEDGSPLLARVARLLGDNDTEVALAAIWALGQIGGESAKRVLKEATKSENEARAQAAADALAEVTLDEGIGGSTRGLHPRNDHNN